VKVAVVADIQDQIEAVDSPDRCLPITGKRLECRTDDQACASLFWGLAGVNIESDIFDIVATQAKVDRDTLKRDTRLSELDLQSIDIIELIFAIEDKFDISVPYNASDLNSAGIAFETVNDLIGAVERLNAEQHAQKAV